MQIRHVLLLAILLLSCLNTSACKGKDNSKNAADSKNNEMESDSMSEIVFREDAVLEITSPQGITRSVFDVEIAASEKASMQGLMYRESMETNQGMLFDPQGLSRNPFWMKNTYIPLDIIFIDEAQKILNIVKNTKPFSEDRVEPTGLYRYVLEINAGLSDKLNLAIGDKITWTP